MADERIQGLPTTAEDLSTFLFIMDKDGELSAVQVPYADIIQPLLDSIALKADKDNVLELDNTDPFTPANDYEPATKKFVEDTVGDLGSWSTPTRGGAISAGATYQVNVRYYKGVVYATGRIEVDVSSGTSNTIFTLPAGFPTPGVNINFSGANAAQEASMQGSILSGSNVVSVSSDTDRNRTYSFHFSYPG